jgi:hypothetical protein
MLQPSTPAHSRLRTSGSRRARAAAYPRSRARVCVGNEEIPPTRRLSPEAVDRRDSQARSCGTGLGNLIPRLLRGSGGARGPVAGRPGRFLHTSQFPGDSHVIWHALCNVSEPRPRPSQATDEVARYNWFLRRARRTGVRFTSRTSEARHSTGAHNAQASKGGSLSSFRPAL